MITKKLSRSSVVFLVVAGALALILSGCDPGVGSTPSSASESIGTLGALGTLSASSGGQVAQNGTFSVDLLAGQHILVGSVSFVVDTQEETLTVVYETQDGWELTEVHLWIGLDLSDMPTNRQGNPVIGHFPFANDQLDGVTSFSFVLTAADLGILDIAELCDATIYGAAHAALQLPDGSGGYQTETGWAAGSPVTQRGSWATYVQFTVECPEDNGDNFFPVWGQDISNVVLVFQQPDGSYYTVKIDEWPSEADNDLDNSIDAILEFLVINHENITSDSMLLGAIIKGGVQTTEYYTYGSGSTGADFADELPEGTGLSLDGTSSNASPQNAINATYDYEEVFE